VKKQCTTHAIRIVKRLFKIATGEAIRWKRKGKEAGGSLVGVQDQHSSTILYAIPTGPKR